MLIDKVTVTVKAGNGGNGALSFKRNAQTAKGGPDGGNGGNGGSVYFQGINDITALNIFRYKKSLKAEDGISGGKKNLFGKNGKDLIVKVPTGTRIIDLSNNNVYEIEDDTAKILLAKGGKGGRGNREFRTALNQTPKQREFGEKGEEKELKLEMRLIADVGLIGLPNAGKSSLLAVLTHANPKIGAYPFTTLEPNLGVLQSQVPYGTWQSRIFNIVIADIPGLIEGAHTGRGLGIEFLRHVEKTKLLIHCVDSTDESPHQAYRTVRKELELYSKSLLELPEIVLLTKIDLIDEKELKKKISSLRHPELAAQGEPRFQRVSGSTKKDILPISIYSSQSLDQLKNLISKMI